jgi:amino acid adenylation domain-containing protein
MTNVLEQERSRNDASDNSEDTITSRFERQVAAVPDKLAIVTDEISLTYRALDRKASCIAAALVSLPSQHDRPIVLFMQDDAARITAMLGVLKTGRIFIPLAPDSPQNWLIRVIQDSGAAHIIVDRSTRSLAELATTGDVTVMEVDQLTQSLQPFVADRTASPDDTAYIVYTSGSTGRPKGVAGSHRRLIRACNVRCSVFGVGRSDRCANLASSGVSVGVLNALMPLLSGGCLFPFDVRRHGLQELAPWFIAHKITYVCLSGSLWRTWLTSLPDDVMLPALRVAEMGGERVYAQDVIRLSRHLVDDWRIWHSFASAEAGHIAAQVFTPSHLPDVGIVALGRPLDGVEVCIKDEKDALVRPGEIGEIVVRSRFLAQGYWNDPDLTAKAFQTDPLDSAIRIYRTGDLGRSRSDGTLEHMGRKGRGIKLQGYSVEPFQVECELLRQPGVTDAVVLLHDRAAGQEPCLVGYVVAPVNSSPSAIRKGLAGCLPPYMVPSHIVVLDSFPIASSGKIDRDALPPPYREEARVSALRMPSDDYEHQLLTIWQEVLKIPKIGIDDDFFELGGGSLQVLKLFATIEGRLGCSLSPTTIMQAPTIARLAEFIRAARGGAASHQSLVPLRTSGISLPLFLVPPDYYGIYGIVHYRHLLKDLRRDRPVFGLQPLPLDRRHHIPRTIESVAADYLSEIRRKQPHGPYFLAGYSFGGLVGFEIAQQLVREGQRVGFLGLIDTVLHDASAKPRSQISAAIRLSRRIYDFLRKPTKYPVSKRWYNLMLRLGRSIPYEQRASFEHWLSARANRGYVPKPYPGHITMFSSAGNSERQRANWGPLAGGGLTILEVPAGHDHMASPPHSKLLAEYFNACLDVTAQGV